MKLLDTNIVIYAIGKEHPCRDACQKVMQQAGDKPEAYGIDVELAQELLDVYGRRGDIARGITAVDEAFALFPDPFPVTRREVEQASELLTFHAHLSPRDAIHAAVVTTYGLEGIVSADRAFEHIPGVKCFDPLKL